MLCMYYNTIDFAAYCYRVQTVYGIYNPCIVSNAYFEIKQQTNSYNIFKRKKIR